MSDQAQDSRSAATDAEMQRLTADSATAEKELLVACNALYIATDKSVADDVKRKANAVIDANAAFNQALATRIKPRAR